MRIDNLDDKISDAVKFYWETRTKQSTRQSAAGTKTKGLEVPSQAGLK